MAVDDWIANLFQSEQTRGLSGALSAAVTVDESNPFYNYRLQRHQVDEDLVGQPLLLWTGSGAAEESGGLQEHLLSSVGQGVAEFTDVLLILSLEDYTRAADVGDEPWPQIASRTLIQQFDSFCRRENFARRFAHRPLGFRILCDGSADMGGQSLGLQAGEFVTGLLPNLYTGPVDGSFPVLAIYVNLPGVWEGYQEVGRLYNDQIVYTIGDSWLDNFSHPSLREGALYRLNRNADGSFVHVVSPDMQDRYQVIAQSQGDHSVMSLATREGEPVAHFLLALLDDSEQTTEGEQAKPAALQDFEFAGSSTVVPESPQDRIFSLQERGALLQRVHFSNFMLGYDVYLGLRGELGTKVENKAATFQVRKRQVSLISHVEGLRVGDHEMAQGEEFIIEGDVVIDAGGQRLEYKDLRGLRVERWPYVGEIRRPASSNYMMWGNEYAIGRARDCRVILPDEPDNSNIVWKPSVGEGAVIRSRTGDIPKSRFYTDSIMVGSEHASIRLETPDPVVVSKNKNCFVYVRRGQAVFPLYPTASGKEPTEMQLQPTDEVLVGNCLFYVGYTPVDEGAQVAPAPPVSVSMVGEEATERVSEAEAAHLADLTPPKAHDITPAGGLGEKGSAPKPLELADTGPDSILGEFYNDDADEAVEEAVEDVADPISAAIAGDEEQTIPAGVVPVEVQAQYELSGEHDSLNLYDDEEDEGIETLEFNASIEEDEGDFVVLDDDLFAPDAGLEEVAAEAPVIEEVVEEPAVEEPVAEEPAAEEPAVEEPAVEEPAAEEPVATAGEVVFVDDSQAQFELGREMQLILVGWVVNGTATLGNHSDASLVLPENRIVPEQQFVATDYFQLKVRGRKGHLKVLAPDELLMDGETPTETDFPNPEGMGFDIIRRDDAGDVDFTVRVELIEDPTLPNPRARLLALDVQDDLAAALVTRGLPTRSVRTLNLAGLEVNLTFTGEQVKVSDYLDTYKTASGYRPFFIQRGEERFVTAPEDGADILLNPGDHLIVGNVLYGLQKT